MGGAARLLTALLALSAALASSDITADGGAARVGSAASPAPAITFAALQLRTYLRLTAGIELQEMPPTNNVTADADLLLLSTADAALLSAAEREALARRCGADTLDRLAALDEGHHWVRTCEDDEGRRGVLLGGGSAGAVLHAAFRFAERALGVGFSVDGDRLPALRRRSLRQLLLDAGTIDEVTTPAFRLRGPNPWQNFFEGLAWWTEDDYLAFFVNVVKMRANFVAILDYSGPMVWDGGPAGAVAPNGSLLSPNGSLAPPSAGGGGYITWSGRNPKAAGPDPDAIPVRAYGVSSPTASPMP